MLIYSLCLANFTKYTSDTIVGDLIVTGNVTGTAGRFTDLHATCTAAFCGLYAHGNVNVAGATTSSLLDVKGTTSLEGTVVLQNNLIIGTRNIGLGGQEGATVSMLRIILPAGVNNYIGTADITYMGINNTKWAELPDEVHLECFIAKYFISRLNYSDTPIVIRISENYFNENGQMATPTMLSQYARADATALTPDANTIELTYTAPSYIFGFYQPTYDTNVTISYEIRSGGVGSYPTNLAGLVAR